MKVFMGIIAYICDKKIFWAQNSNPVKNEWSTVVKEDLQFFEPELSQMKNDKSKMKDLSYTDIDLQSYLASNKLILRQKRLLYRFRTRMVNCGYNMGQQSLCPVCQGGPDNQQHIMSQCPSLQVANPDNCEYSDIFSDDVLRLESVANYLERVWRLREEKLEKQN